MTIKNTIQNILLAKIFFILYVTSISAYADGPLFNYLPPSNTDCASQYPLDRGLFGPSIAENFSLENCATYCNNAGGGCGGFSYNEQQKRCILKPQNACNISRETTGYQFYERATSNINSGGATYVSTTSYDCVGNNQEGKSSGLDLLSCLSKCAGDSECSGVSFETNIFRGSNSCIPKTNLTICDQQNGSYTYYKKASAAPSDDPSAFPGTCVGKDGKLTKDCESYHKVDFPPEEDAKMLIYDRVNRNTTPQANKSATDAILAQTSYLARVMTQANDVFPPSHVSTRVSGETYNSSVIPVEFNTKSLIQAAVQRNTLGAPAIYEIGDKSGSGGNKRGTSDGLAKQSTVMHDWVEFHLGKYCDPLALSQGLCSIPNISRWNCANSIPSGHDLINMQVKGMTTWDTCFKTVKDPKNPDRQVIDTGAFASDINASTLFKSTIKDPEAAMRYVYNVTNVTPTPFSPPLPTDKPGTATYAIPDKYIGKDASGNTVIKNEGYGEYMNYLGSQSKMSLSQYAFMKIFAERIPMNNLKIPKDVWTEDGKKNTQYVQTSRDGLLEFEASKRFSDPAWFDRVQQMPQEAVMKELSYMMATQLLIDYKRYEQQQVQTAVMASMAADISKLITQMQAMTGQSSSAQDTLKKYIGDSAVPSDD